MSCTAHSEEETNQEGGTLRELIEPDTAESKLVKPFSSSAFSMVFVARYSSRAWRVRVRGYV